MKTVLALLFFGLTSPISIPTEWSKRERAAAEKVRASTIADHVRALADDKMEGRGAGSRGDDLAMEYIAAQYKKLGLRPAGDEGSYLQRFDIVGMKTKVTTPPVARGKNGTITLHPPLDSIVAAGDQKASARLNDAELVFCGYGITAPEQKWDDFKDVDVRGKVIVVMNNDPENDPNLFAGQTRLYYGRWSYKFEEAARKGAAGTILIHTEHSAGYPWQVVQTSWTGEDFELPTAGEPRTQVRMWTTEEATRKLVQLGGFDLDELRKRAESRDFRPVPLGIKLSVGIQSDVRRVKTANVLGVLDGSDAKLTKQLVVYSAHHDHLGVREAPPGKAGGDNIYNGALDNASGVAAMLNAAEAIVGAGAKPRRSILFAAVGVEESGLLGSEYFAKHPIVPVGRIAADINIDGINIWGRTRDVEFTGLGKSSLDDVVIAAAKAQGRVVKPDQFPDRGHFYRSDQFSFARVGVPGVYVGRGLDFVGHEPGWGKERVEEYVKTRYHQPSDQMDASWNLDGAVDDLRLLVTVGLRVADAPGLPTWKPGDEFEAARRQALEETK
jgi:Zn-dependent M28 family amino/carboxypeptidase